MCSVDDPCDPVEPSDGDGSGGLVVRPSAEELLRPPQRNLLCPEPGCGRRLPQPSALRFHLLRRHGRRAIRGSAAVPRSAVFACPQADCAAHSAGRKTQFGSLKALKQHYLKVHAPRTLVCPECGTAAFASEALLRSHWRLCGVSHQCSCGAQYTNISTLRSHAAKHGHVILMAVRPPAVRSDGLRRLAPKPSPDALHLLASIALAGVPARAARPVTTCDAGTQTAARRAPRGGRSSGTQTRLTSGPATGAGSDPPPPPPLPPPPAPTSRTAGSQCVTVAAASAASQAGPPLVWGLLWPAPPAAAGLISCQTQTDERRPARQTQATQAQTQATRAQAQATQAQAQARPLEELLWEAQEVSELVLAPPTASQQLPTSQQTQTPPLVTPGRQPAALGQPAVPPPPPPPPPPPAAESQTEADMLSAETQTQDPFDVIKHMLRSEDERLLFPELSELSGTDIQTQTPWLTGDSQTQTPWWSDDPARMMTSQTQTAPVTHMETQTCLLCLGPCDCWGD